jgi:hypothetical protein
MTLQRSSLVERRQGVADLRLKPAPLALDLGLQLLRLAGAGY